jgi:HSP20 family protein
MSQKETLPVRKAASILDELREVENRIRQRAFELFSGNGILGRDLSNWLNAEDELTWKPSIELREKDNQFKIEIAVPGVEAKALDIEVTPENVLVKGETRREHKEEKGNIQTSEFKYGNLFRAIQLPKKIDPDKVKAELKNGILYLTADIAAESQAKKVSIQAA